MSLECFRVKNLRGEALKLIDRCNAIIEDYTEQGLRLTLRQLYYQLVSSNVIANEEKSYKRLGGVVSDARLAGLMDWDAIEDRGRVAEKASEFDDLSDLVAAAMRSYRLPRWKGQRHYVELWVEKQALAGVLDPIAREYHITLMVNKGYSSQSAMYESAKRFKAAAEEPIESRSKLYEDTKQLHLFYLGDHDPSGEDMVRDVGDRMEMFGVVDLDVQKLALTMDQIKRYNPPPNPAKLTDSRAAAYIEKFGDSSWEVDALPPNVLTALIRKALDRVVDKPAMDAVKAREKDDKERLEAAVAEIMEQ